MTLVPRDIRTAGHTAACILAIAWAGCLAGCAGYRVGNQTLYRPDVQTVNVPVFQSDGFRRGWGELLTEAVVKHIELKTPYKVVGPAEADSVLIGRIVDITKTPLVENRHDEPRDVELGVRVDVEWRDRRGDLICQTNGLPLPPALVHVGQASDFIPEGGQSLATAQIEALDRLAEQIVSQMEVEW